MATPDGRRLHDLQWSMDEPAASRAEARHDLVDAPAACHARAVNSVYDAVGASALQRLARYHDAADDVPDGLQTDR